MLAGSAIIGAAELVADCGVAAIDRYRPAATQAVAASVCAGVGVVAAAKVCDTVLRPSAALLIGSLGADVSGVAAPVGAVCAVGVDAILAGVAAVTVVTDLHARAFTNADRSAWCAVVAGASLAASVGDTGVTTVVGLAAVDALAAAVAAALASVRVANFAIDWAASTDTTTTVVGAAELIGAIGNTDTFTEDAVLIGGAVATIAGVDTGSVHADFAIRTVHAKAGVDETVAVNADFRFFTLDFRTGGDGAAIGIAGFSFGAASLTGIEIKAGTALTELVGSTLNPQAGARWKATCHTAALIAGEASVAVHGKTGVYYRNAFHSAQLAFIAEVFLEKAGIWGTAAVKASLAGGAGLSSRSITAIGHWSGVADARVDVCIVLIRITACDER